MIQKILALIIGLLTGGVSQQNTAPGAVAAGSNSILFYTGVIGFVTWLVSPAGRNFDITLHGWEIWAVVLASGVAGALLHNMKSPGPP